MFHMFHFLSLFLYISFFLLCLLVVGCQLDGSEIKFLDKTPITAVFCAEWRGAVVAVKMLRTDGGAGAAGQDAFNREASLMRSLLQHPNVVALYGVAARMIVTEFVAGGSLLARLIWHLRRLGQQ
eukprot:TRINITY_DN5990_c0_g2_i1.p2 TRINITY_DN5990_c0_g2~~TRINITY_DN5990_c0_g2_i1.p2  ORF type:complete len:125 (-),score=15.66 TRINITY_DN5990_c0_g2_i1:182-556(-)